MTVFLPKPNNTSPTFEKQMPKLIVPMKRIVFRPCVRKETLLFFELPLDQKILMHSTVNQNRRFM